MIDLYTWTTPNGRKASIMLEEIGLPYTVHSIDIGKDEQFAPAFLKISPNNRIPAIVDRDNGMSVFESGALMIYLGDKTGQFIGSASDRPELLSWLFFIGTGLGPFSGQAVHFQRAAPEKLPYAINRYRREAERHYSVLNRHLDGRAFVVGDSYTIADMSAWGWICRAAFVLPGSDDPLADYPHIKRWFQAIDARPAAARARALGTDHAFKREVDEEYRRAMFPTNYADVVF